MVRFFQGLLITILMLSCIMRADAQTTGWARIPGGNSANKLYNSCFDSRGNSFMAGCFENAPIELGSTMLLPISGKDAFIASYNTNGNVRWAKEIGGSEIDVAQAICFDSVGNVFAAGYFNSSSIFLDGSTLAAHTGYDFFIAKYDSLGHLLWATNPDQSNGNETLNDITVDRFGNVYAIGSFDGSSITLGAFTLQNTSNGKALLLFKLDPTGTVIWARTSTGAGNEEGNKITMGLNEDVFIAGCYEGAVMTLQGQNLENENAQGYSSDIFYAHYDKNGALLTLDKIGGNGQDKVCDILFTQDAHVVLTGTFDGPSVQFNNQTYLYSAGGADIFIARCQDNGSVINTQSIGGSGDETAGQLSLDTDAGFLLCGESSSLVLNPGSTSYLNLGKTDMFIARFNAGGQQEWLRMFGAEGIDAGLQAKRLSDGTLIFCGNTNSQNLNLGSNPVSPLGRANAFICKLEKITGISSEVTHQPRKISCFPNPTGGDMEFNCPWSENAKHNSLVMIIDAAGHCVYRANIDCNKQKNHIELQQLPSGIYNLQIISGDKKAQQTIVISH